MVHLEIKTESIKEKDILKQIYIRNTITLLNYEKQLTHKHTIPNKHRVQSSRQM